MTFGACRLCERDAELQLSHILPAFTYRWLRESSGNGHIRSSNEPNLRVQDGLKFYWLCSTCEQLFSKSETAFSGRLFHPYIQDGGRIYPYTTWLLSFCVSVSWRVLRFYLDEGHLKNWDAEAVAIVSEAEQTWRDFLLGKRAHPGQYQQHLLPLDMISETSADFAPNINRYLMRAIHMDFCRGSRSIFTYAKLGRFLIIGIVHEPTQGQWKGTKVHATHGYVEPKKYMVPRALADYWTEKAKNMRAALGSMSDRQHEKVEKTFRANIDKFIGSDAFIAMQADIDMFGNDAFTPRESSK